MQKNIDKTDRYPVYTMSNPYWGGPPPIEVSDEFNARYEKVFDDFEVMQKELRKLTKPDPS